MPFDAGGEDGLWHLAGNRIGEFDAGAVDYDRYRPRYPEDVVEDLVTMAVLATGARVLEVGCGTGIANRGAARSGAERGRRRAGPQNGGAGQG